jgi:hypothetical protein
MARGEKISVLQNLSHSFRIRSRFAFRTSDVQVPAGKNSVPQSAASIQLLHCRHFGSYQGLKFQLFDSPRRGDRAVTRKTSSQSFDNVLQALDPKE